MESAGYLSIKPLVSSELSSSEDKDEDHDYNEGANTDIHTIIFLMTRFRNAFDHHIKKACHAWNYPINLSLKKIENKFAQLKSCTYICNQQVAHLGIQMKQDIFQAISDPTRRAILALLAIQALTPNVMAEKFDMSRQAVSKHIRVLQECELIKPEQSGREIYYHFNARKMQEFDKWLAQFRQNWEDQFNQLDQVLSTIKRQKR